MYVRGGCSRHVICLTQFYIATAVCASLVYVCIEGKQKFT